MNDLKGFAPWKPNKATQVYVDDILEVMESQRQYWPLTQRYWLYRLMGLKGWLKVDEYSRSKAPEKDRHLCTPNKNLNNILTRGRRAGIIPWEAVTSGRGIISSASSCGSPIVMANWIEDIIKGEQFERQLGQKRRVVLWMETEGLVSLVKPTAHHYGATVLAGKGFDTLGNKHAFAQTIASEGNVLILHCGDLDKSGHTVFTALEEDLQAFVADMGGEMELKRIALTEAQAIHFNLQTSPTPAGLNDGNHGRGFTSKVECQLEAMDAPDLIQFIKDAFEAELDMVMFEDRVAQEAAKKVEAMEILIDRQGG